MSLYLNNKEERAPLADNSTEAAHTAIISAKLLIDSTIMSTSERNSSDSFNWIKIFSPSMALIPYQDPKEVIFSGIYKAIHAFLLISESIGIDTCATSSLPRARFWI